MACWPCEQKRRQLMAAVRSRDTAGALRAVREGAAVAMAKMSESRYGEPPKPAATSRYYHTIRWPKR